MVHLRISILSQPDREVVVGSLPARLGRSPRCEIVCEADGIWDEHLRLTLDPSHRLAVEAVHHALVTVNDQRIGHAVLKPRDRINCGGATLEISLAPPVARANALAGIAIWIIFGLTFVLQFVLAVTLLRQS